MRLKTLIFYIVLTLIITAIIIIMITTYSNPRDNYASALVTFGVPVIIDAGHGGLDGGAVSAAGLLEAPINLNISKRISAFLSLIGVDNVLLREDENSLDFNPQLSVRENKNADLKARLNAAKQLPESDFLSIHLNKYTQPQYSGAQVFFSPNNGKSKLLAEAVQTQMVNILNPQNNRQHKECPDSVFLMKEINAPAITIECGFLSNPEEALLLQSNEYQTKIAIAISAGYIKFLEGK